MNEQEAAQLLKKTGVSEKLAQKLLEFRREYPVPAELQDRIRKPEYFYYGTHVWEMALAALMAGKNLLLAGPKATGKNVLSENLSYLCGRPEWNVSFHINMDAAALVGADTFDGQKVIFRPGPITLAAENGGFAVLDEINMAKNEALAVLHSALDFRHVMDVPGYRRVQISPAARFIGTMNYGYAGTRNLNQALSSRFVIIDMPVIGEDSLRQLIMDAYPDMRAEICGQFMKLFYELQKKAEHGDISDSAVDLRGLLDAIGLVHTGLASGDAIEMCIINKTFDTYEQNLIRDTVKARIPQDLTEEICFN